MASPAVSSKFRAVVCRHCGKPIRVPGLITRKELEFQGLTDSGDVHYHLISRVFNVRCRSCERESVYSINQIVDYPYSLAPSATDHNSAAL
jgi:ribosomal protein S27E